MRTAAPARRHSSALPGSSAGSDELYGSDRPSASIATAIVLAVYMPPHAPAPGHAWRTISMRCSSVMTPAMYSPYDWKAEMMSRGLPSACPARIVPPYTISDGRFSRAIAMTDPGMFLSQPGTVTSASYHCAPITVSIESAIRSRDGSE